MTESRSEIAWGGEGKERARGKDSKEAGEISWVMDIC